MTQWLPWLQSSPEQKQQIKALALRFGINVEDEGQYNRTTRSLGIGSQYWNMISYTARNALNDFQSYLKGRRYYSYYYTENNNNDEIKANGLFEYTLLSFLGDFAPEIKDLFLKAFLVCDRSGTDRQDPITTDNFKIAYIPKGITDFNPTTKKLNEELTAKIQREIIKENKDDTSLEGKDATITVKVFNELNTADDKIFHVYFNKKEPQTIRRVIYKSIREAIKYFNITEHITVQNEENPIERNLFNSLADIFFNAKEDAISNILEELESYIQAKLAYQDKNIIQIFAARKQTAMNEQRKRSLEEALNYAKTQYERNLQDFASLRNDYLQAKKAVDSYQEVEFNAITVLLTKIKEHPGTKLFAKINNDNLQFLIEEPLIHTDSAVWAKYLGNTSSDINFIIKNFTEAHYNKYNTTFDILRFAVQRFIKELFVDQKYRVYTAALLGLRASTNTFQIEKYNLPDDNFLPHPHIGTSSITCWAEASREISKKVMENDGETAFLQLIYALQQMTASDSIISKKLISLIVDDKYSTQPFYIKKGSENRTSFKEIIKEFVTDETNKINAINDSES